MKLLGLEGSYEKMEALVKSERSPHALLILGEKGVGKSCFALHFAMALLCKNNGCPCFNCTSCKKAINYNHPDIIYAKGNEKTGSIGVDEIRRLRGETSKVPQESSKKIFIIEDAQNLTVEAQNAFLKILEEPPEDTVFILTCSKEEALLETVISRLTLLCLPIISDELKAEALRQIDENLAGEEASRAAGIFSTVGQALSVLTPGPSKDNFEKSLKLTELIKKKDRYGMLCLLSSMGSTKDRENLKEVLAFTLQVCLYETRKKNGISSRFMDRIDKSICEGLSLLAGNVSPLAAGALAAENICSQI